MTMADSIFRFQAKVRGKILFKEGSASTWGEAEIFFSSKEQIKQLTLQIIERMLKRVELD